MSGKPRKLARKFVTTRLNELLTVPVSWQVKRLFEDKFVELDLRLCNISDLRGQCTFMFDVADGNNLTATNVPASSSQHDSNSKSDKAIMEEKDRLFQTPSWILQLDLSLNAMESLDIEDLSPFAELRSLNASLNLLKHISGIVACSQLTILCLAYNNLCHLPFSALQQCKHLYKLDLCSNNIESVSQMPALSNLEYLNLNHNELKSPDGLHVLLSLRNLFMRHNKLENTISLSACTQLRQVDLSHNFLANLEDISATFSHLKFLQQIDLVGNPVSEQSFIEIQQIMNRETSAILLNGVNIGSMKDQFTHLRDAQPPFPANSLRLELKDAVHKAMKHNLDTHRRQHEIHMEYLHKKLLAMIMEMNEFQAKVEIDTEAWCSHIDTLSADELQGFSLSQIQAQLSGNVWSTKDLPAKQL